MYSDMNNLDWLLAYELNQSIRHRRYLSLIMLSLTEGSQKLAGLLRHGVRQSDSMFFSDKVAVVLMGETSKPEAVRAVNRYCDEFNGRLD